MKKLLEAMYSVWSFHNVDFLELVKEHKLTEEMSLLDVFDLWLSGPPYNVQSGRKNVNSHKDVLSLEGMVNAVALGKRVMRTDAHGHLFCFVLHIGQLY